MKERPENVAHAREYLRGLDGLRGLAIIGVLVFHVFPAVLPGGFTGVDVFFVLSGFLITTNILGDLRAGSFSLGEFYLRRVQRLIPNALMVGATTLLLWLWLLPPSAAQSVARHLVWVLGNLSNIHIWRSVGGYWGASAESSPLTHTWSLAIEEQFYFILPVLLIWLGRRSPRLALGLVLSALGLSLLAGLVASFRTPIAGFYLLPSRAWQLLSGSALAMVLASRQAQARDGFPPRFPWARTAGWSGMGIVVIGYLLLRGSPSYPGFLAIFPTLGSVLVLYGASEGGSRLAAVLEWLPLSALGRASYSLYLWHWPMLCLGRMLADLMDRNRQVYGILGVVAGVLLGLVSYRLVEQPLRRRGPGRRLRLAGIAAAFTAVALWAAVVARRPFETDPEDRFDDTIYRGNLYDAAWGYAPDEPLGVHFKDLAMPSLSEIRPKAWMGGGIIRRYGDDVPKVVVFGSSQAASLAGTIDAVCEEKGLTVSFLCVHGSPAFFPTPVGVGFKSESEARAFDAARLRWLASWRPQVLVVADRWELRAEGPDELEKRMGEFLDAVAPFVGRILLVSHVPVCSVGESVNLREYVSWRVSLDGRFPRIPVDSGEVRRLRMLERMEQMAGRRPNVEVLRIDRPFLEADGTVRYRDGRRFLYADDDHLSQAGADELRGIFREALRLQPP